MTTTDTTNTDRAALYVAVTFEALATTGGVLVYDEAAKNAQELLARYLPLLDETDRYLLAGIATALYLCRDECTGQIRAATADEVLQCIGGAEQ